MEKVMEPKQALFTNLKNSFYMRKKHEVLNIYPQMPAKQIQHFVKQAVRKNQSVTIQLNPSSYAKELKEVSGQISLSPTSSHVILQTVKEQTIYLIQPQQIRHLRLA